MPIEQVRHSPTWSRSAFDFDREVAGGRHLPLGAHQPARHLVDRADLLDRQASIDRLQDAFVIVGVEPVVGLDRDDGRAQPPRLPHERSGLDAEPLAA
jgi:hypothetical protein